MCGTYHTIRWRRALGNNMYVCTRVYSSWVSGSPNMRRILSSMPCGTPMKIIDNTGYHTL